MKKEKDWHSPKEVADDLDLTEDTIWNWLNAGKLPGYKFGGRWRVNKAEYEKWKKEQRNIQESTNE